MGIIILLSIMAGLVFCWFLIHSRSWVSIWMTQRETHDLKTEIHTIKLRLEQQDQIYLQSLKDALFQMQQHQQGLWLEHQRALNQPLETLKLKLYDLDKWHQQIDYLSQRVHGLSKIFDHSMLKGKFGERHLEALLGDRYPSQWIDKQVLFPSGVRADFVLKNPHNGLLLAIDSKFPLQSFRCVLENEEKTEYKKDFLNIMKKNIKDIADKYILANFTVSYAICFVPSDALYLKLIEMEELMIFAQKYHIWIACPQTLYGICDMWAWEYKQQATLSKEQAFLSIIQEISENLIAHKTQIVDIEKKALALRKEIKNLKESAEHLADLFEEVDLYEKKYSLKERENLIEMTPVSL